MIKSELGIFRHGACEFMGYLLPMIILSSYDAPHLTHHVYKYRQPRLAKEEAETIALNELEEIINASHNIFDKMAKMMCILEKLKLHHYYPAPEFYPDWEHEWKLNFKTVNKHFKY